MGEQGSSQVVRGIENGTQRANRNRKGTIELQLTRRSPQVPQICMCTEWAVRGVAPFSLPHELAVYVCVCVREKQQRDSSVLLIVVYQWPRMLLKFDNSPN